MTTKAAIHAHRFAASNMQAGQASARKQCGQRCWQKRQAHVALPDLRD